MRKITVAIIRNFGMAALVAAGAIGGAVYAAPAGESAPTKAVTVRDSAAKRVNPPAAKNAKQKSINIRQGRRIQVDGFLLEWKEADARRWPGTAWLWDAVSTADGVAGYVSLPAKAVTAGGADSGVNKSVGANAAAWVFTVRAANTGKAVEARVPGRSSGEFFAYDKEAFERGESLTAEWIVPWSFFDDGEEADVYELTVSATGAAGALPPLTISAAAPQTPGAPAGLMTRAAMIAIIAALTVALTLHRRKRMRESKSK